MSSISPELWRRIEPILERALALDPSLYRAHLVLAQIALAQRDEAAARSHLEASLRISPDQPERAETEETLRRLGG